MSINADYAGIADLLYPGNPAELKTEIDTIFPKRFPSVVLSPFETKKIADSLFQAPESGGEFQKGIPYFLPQRAMLPNSHTFFSLAEGGTVFAVKAEERGRIGRGGFKKVNRGIIVSRSCSRLQTEECAYLRMAVRDPRLTDEQQARRIRNIANELLIYERFPDTRGIAAKPSSVFAYQKGNKTKVVFIQKHYPKDFHTHLEEQYGYTSSRWYEARIQSARYMADIFAGLEKMHESGLSHGDIKPENIVIKEEKAALCDFSCAMKESDFRKYLESGGALGTEATKPPEWYRKGPVWRSLNRENPEHTGYPLKGDVWMLGLSLVGAFAEGAIEDPIFEDLYVRGWRQLYDEGRFPDLEQQGGIEGSFFSEPEDPKRIDHLLWRMLRLDPRKRPSVTEAFDAFKTVCRECYNITID